MRFFTTFAEKAEIMEFLSNLFGGSGVATTLVYLSLTAFAGIALGKLKLGKINLGIAGVLFVGLFIANLGAKVDGHTLHFMREFGLILFVYAIGIDIGPRFVSSFRNDGIRLNLFAVSIVLLGFGVALLLHYVADVPSAIITGIMSGAVTNTPGLGAAQEVLRNFGNEADLTGIGMAYATAYPIGVFGIILTMILVKAFFRINVSNEVERYNESNRAGSQKLESVRVHINNPNLFNQSLGYIKTLIDKDLVISRIERNGEFFVPDDADVFKEGDLIYGVSDHNRVDSLRLKVGKVDLDVKREMPGDMAMSHILVTNRKLAGKTIEQIGIYRRYEANITRIFRAGLEILPTRESVVELGDTVRVVGKRDLLNEVKNELGNSVMELAHPNTIPIFLGIFLGIIVGSIPFFIPGLPVPAKLGLAGGPLLIAIVLGHYGRVGSFDFYMTPGANMMIKDLGITLFLACVGLLSGGQFIQTIADGGYMWLIYGAMITLIPIIIVGIIARMMNTNYLKICGILAGAMTDPPALEFANLQAPVHAQSSAYATVYPLTMFLRIILAQALILITH